MNFTVRVPYCCVTQLFLLQLQQSYGWRCEISARRQFTLSTNHGRKDASERLTQSCPYLLQIAMHRLFVFRRNAPQSSYPLRKSPCHQPGICCPRTAGSGPSNHRPGEEAWVALQGRSFHSFHNSSSSQCIFWGECRG